MRNTITPAAKASKAELDTQQGAVVYEVEVAAKDGKVYEVIIDAKNGKVLSSRVDN